MHFLRDGKRLISKVQAFVVAMLLALVTDFYSPDPCQTTNIDQFEHTCMHLLIHFACLIKGYLYGSWGVRWDGTLNGISPCLCISLICPVHFYGKNFARTFFVPSRQSGITPARFAGTIC